MPYNINNYDGTFLVSVPNSTICTTSTSLGLIGQNAVNFGLTMNENFVYLLQNFSSSTPPASPIEGQVWYNSVTSVMNFYDGTQWQTLSPPFDGDAGTAQVLITAVNPQVEVTVMFSAGLIVAAVSHFSLSPSQLPLYAQVGDTTFPFQSRFPEGISPGITLATIPSSTGNQSGYLFYGTATSANVLASSRCIILCGSVTGNVSFNGSNDVVINTTLINALQGNVISNANVTTLPAWFTNVYVNSNGIVTDATALNSCDIFTALQYQPPQYMTFTGNVNGNTTANGTIYTANIYLNCQPAITPGYYSNVYVGQNGLVVSANNDNSVPPQGIIVWGNPGQIPNGWVVANGQSVMLPNGNTINTPDIANSAPSCTTYIMRIS
jgi:hypothetical protein